MSTRRIVVDAAAIEENFKLLRRNIGESTRPIWVVKSSVYGLGLECISRVSADLAGYATEDFITAEEVLARDRTRPVYVLYPISPAYCPEKVLPRVMEGSIVPTLENQEQIQAWSLLSKKHGGKGLGIQIKVRSFGGRFGVAPAELAGFIQTAEKGGLKVQGIFSHSSRSTVYSQAELEEECEHFVKISRKVAPGALIHFADSACVLRGVGVRLDCVRVGLLPLGILPMETDARWSGLRVAFRLLARVVSQRPLEEGEWIGYNQKTGETPSHVAIVAIGYAHGLPRRIQKAGYAVWRGQRIKYAAPPWMEFSPLGLPADWREILDDEVEILGPNVPPHELALATGMLPEEFFVRLSLAIPREILGSTEI